jgi:hypothetical protein
VKAWGVALLLYAFVVAANSSSSGHNIEHPHAGIALMTPHTVHHGHAESDSEAAGNH